MHTVEAFYAHVSPKPHLHVADDGSALSLRRDLMRVGLRAGAPTASMSDSARGGYGRNVNLATQALHSDYDYVFMLEDDWELLRPLNLLELVEDLEKNPEINGIRLGYLSFTQTLGGCIVGNGGRKYLLLDSQSAEPHVFAGHPRLERVSYQRAVGAWPEGLAPGATEFAVAHMPAARMGVAWPLGLDTREGYGLFAHIGSVKAEYP
jgi:hypothetical protein